MARTAYIPYDPSRDEQRADERRERRAARNEEIDFTAPHRNFGNLDPQDPEFETVEVFAEFLMDDERDSFTYQELNCVAYRVSVPVPQVQTELESFGLHLQHRPHAKRFRGVRENPYTLYAGNPMCSGSGGNSIIGLAD